MPNQLKKLTIALAGALSLTACQDNNQPAAQVTPAAKEQVAFGAPGEKSTWAYSGKTGIGSSYEQYQNGAYSDDANTGTVSKVWFSLAKGVITETMFGLIHEAQIKDMQFIIVGDGFVDIESEDTNSTIEYLHTDEAGRPLSLAYKLVNTDKDGKYKIEKHVFTDPDNNTLYVKAFVTALSGEITPYISVNPHVNNNGSNDKAYSKSNGLFATDSGKYLSLKAKQGFEQTSVGFRGESGSLADLKDGNMDHQFTTTGEQAGNVELTAKLATVSANSDKVSVEYDLVLGFGNSEQASEQAADNSLAKGYQQVLAHYNGEGEHIGWQDYLASLSKLDDMVATTTDNGQLLYTSALVLKAQEDKTHAGALIASLSNPWGDVVSAENSSTGYKAVWPRDFYQCAMALLALGDTQTPLVSFEYLEQIQVSDKLKENKGDGGWFLQKTHVDGTIEWVSVQLDQTAMPIMLAWKLYQNEVLDKDSLINWYQKMLKPAADFLVDGGMAIIDWNNTKITPPHTQQERWEEQPGYSPSTTAAIITGLSAAAEMAKLAGDNEQSTRYLTTATNYASQIEALMFTTEGNHSSDGNNGQYFVRISNQQPINADESLGNNNGKPGLDKKSILDAGFLELVRYGVRAADDQAILDSLTELDSDKLEENLKVKYNFSFDGVDGQFPGWRRYGNDGYGEDAETGLGYHAVGNHTQGQRGRVWPFFTGERGHFELALAKKTDDKLTAQELTELRETYVKAMELFANEGMMLPEQVWDGVGKNDTYNFVKGEGTNSATPLAWTHAEYVKLIRSYSDEKIWDNYQDLTKKFQR